jgi:hypothetical protein
MFAGTEEARRRYNEFVEHYNAVIEGTASGCPYGCPYSDGPQNIRWHKEYLARLD